MTKIVDEPKVITHKEINGEQIPIYSCKTETVLTNKKTVEQLMKVKKQLLMMLPILIQILKKKISREMSRFLHLD